MHEDTAHPAVLIVSYRRADLLRRCLDSVRAHLPGSRILVWDNKSSGSDDIEELSAEYPDIEWQFCERNIGFAAAVNALAATVPGQDLLLLNPDAELTGPLLRCRRALGEPDVAVVSPTVVEPDGRPRWDVAHKRITLTRALVDYAGYAPKLRGRGVSTRYLAPPREVDGYLTGCCLFVSAKAWATLGPYDESFFLYGEEAAWQAVARRNGWRLLLVDEPEVRHGAAGTVSGDSAAGRRSLDLLRAGVANTLGVHGNGGQGTLFTAGAHLLDRVQRSKRLAKASTGKPTVLLTSNALAQGGAERQRVLLANELSARGYPVTLICLQQFGPLLPELDAAVRLVYSPWWQPFVQLGTEHSVLITGVTNTEGGFALGWRALHPGRAHRWLAASHESTADGPTYGAKLGRIIARSDGIIALSADHWAEISRFQHIGARHFVAPNGVAPLPDRGYRPLRPLRFGMLSRIAELKNPHLLVEALAMLKDPEWTLDIFGDGPDRARLQALTPPELAERVRWHGASPGPDHAFAELDVLCVPSRTEAFPLVIVEAMVRGLPVIASAVGSVPDMLDHGDAGTLVHPVTAQAWAQALRAVLADPERLRPLAAKAHSRANTLYTVSAMVDAYEKAIAG